MSKISKPPKNCRAQKYLSKERNRFSDVCPMGVVTAVYGGAICAFSTEWNKTVRSETIVLFCVNMSAEPSW